MKRATGIGGVFFKCADTAAQADWYRRHLGVEIGGGWTFEWREKERPEVVGHTVVSAFKEDTTYFAPSDKPFMLNFRIDDLDAVIAALRAEGVTVDDRIEESEYGRFGWIMDPEGNRIELWQPPAETPAEA